MVARYWSIYKHQEVKNLGDGFKGLSNSGNRTDGAIRYDFGDKKVSTYIAIWDGMGWNLMVTDWIGDYEYSNSGGLIGLSHDRIIAKSYTD